MVESSVVFPALSRPSSRMEYSVGHLLERGRGWGGWGEGWRGG